MSGRDIDSRSVRYRRGGGLIWFALLATVWFSAVSAPPVSAAELSGSEPRSAGSADQVDRAGEKRAGAETADSGNSDAEKPDSRKPESEKPESEKPESEKPESEKPESEKPESEKPESEKPESEKPESEKTESEKTDRTGDQERGASEQSPVDGLTASASDEPPAESLSWPLPAAAPDGRPFRPIALFASQLAELIPDHYRPVALGQLAEALSENPHLIRDQHHSRVEASYYEVELRGDTLVSERSVLHLESDVQGPVRHSLGTVNFSLDPAGASTAASDRSSARLETATDGSLVAMIDGDSQVEFGWTLRGTSSGDYRDFELQVPRSPQTQIELTTPRNVAVEALDGVMRRMPALPKPASAASGADSDRRRYMLDVGGLGVIRLRIQLLDEDRAETTLLVRRSSLQYDVESSGVSWTARMAIQIPPRSTLPPLLIHGGTVTSVQIDGVDVSYTIASRGAASQLRLQQPSQPRAGDTPLSVTISGRASWSGKSGWCKLPWPVWQCDRVIHASATSEARLRVVDPLSVLTWQLPEGWTHEAASRLSDTATVLQAQGPPLVPPSASPRNASTATRDARESENRENDEDNEREDNERKDNDSHGEPRRSDHRTHPGSWSRVRLMTGSSLQASDSLLRLDIEPETLQASARITLIVDPERIEPIPVRVQPGWSLRSLRLPTSGRVIEAPSPDPATGVVSIWPVSEDVENSELIIEATGRAPLTAGQPVTVPSTWFVRVGGVLGDFVTAVVPPSALNWSGETALQGQPIERGELTDDQQLFLQNIPDKTLIFRPRTGRTPQLRLQPPSVAFSVSTSLRFGRQEEGVWEQLVIETDTSTQLPPQLTILTGPASQRPDYHWSLRAEREDSEPISLPASDVQLEDRDGEGIYTVDLSDHDWRGRELVGRRRYPLGGELETRLPSIPRAASQNAEAFLESGLFVRESSPAVLRVPIEHDPRSSTTRLRYDAVDQPAIVIGAAESDPPVAMVWQEDLQLTASSRGTDRIEAFYRVTSPQPIRIDYPAGLELSAIYRNGEAVDLMSVPRHPIELPGSAGTDSIHLIWNRTQVDPGVIRRCAIPPLEISGVVFKSQHRLSPSADSFVPAMLWQPFGVDDSFLSDRPLVIGRPFAISVRRGHSVLLVQRNVALATGWLVALLVFAFSWWIARRRPAVSVIGVGAFASAALLWVPWATAIVGWAVLPCAAGGLLAASIGWNRRRTDRAPGRIRLDAGPYGSEWREGSSGNARLSSRGGLGRSSRRLLLAAVVAFTPASTSWAQDEPDQSPPPDVPAAIDVLVPVDAQGKRLGDKIYIPQTVYRELFRVPTPDSPKEVRFTEANYQLNLSAQRELTVIADYALRLDRSATKLRLPIDAQSIRRVELVQSDADRIVRFTDSGDDQTIVTVPPGDQFRLRLTMVPEINISESLHRLQLDVPRITAAQLTVEADRGIDSVEITLSAGEVQSDPELRRWVAQIGPVDSLRVRYRAVDRLAEGGTEPLGRRFWIHVGKDRTVVDCEISPPGPLAMGESVDLVVLDSDLPTVVSPAWRLQRTELLSPSRWLVTFVKRTDSAAPIRLLWSRETVIDAPQQGPSESGAPLQPGEGTQSMAIPEVIASGSDRSAPAWVAIQSDPDLRVSPVNRQPTEPLAVDQFVAAWKGYRGRIDRALVALGQLPPISVTRRPQVDASVAQQHHVHVTREELQLRYVAKLNRGDMTSARRTLRLPRGVDLLNLTVNGRAVRARPNRAGEFREVALGHLPDRDVVTIEATAVVPLGAGNRFTLPQLRIWPRVETIDNYTLSRDHATRIRTLRSPNVESDAGTDLDTAEALTEGWVPVGSWTLHRSPESASAHSLGGLFKMIERPTRFDSRQLIALFWTQGRWSMETTIELRSKPVPDYIDVELPSRWCESLEIEPGTVWSRQPATDPSYQVIRIRCTPNAVNDQPITIRGRLESSDKGRLSVPPVDVLGNGRRRVLISVPDRLTNESVQWRTSAVAAIEQLPQWASKIAPEGARSTYSAASAAWSIELASLPQVSTEASATAGDFQIFPKSDHTLILARWDLVPGGLDSVAVRLPPNASCLGAWTAGRAVNPRPEPAPGAAASQSDSGAQADAADEPTPPILRIPLSLSRLSQPVEVLLRIPDRRADRRDYLPELLDITVGQRWIAQYATTPKPDARSGQSSLRQQADRRYRSLAQSIVQSVEQSLDLLAERPTTEVANWLTPWASRYQQLAEAAGHQVDWSSESPEGSDAGDEESAQPESSQPEPAENGTAPRGNDAAVAETVPPNEGQSWNELDRRMAVQVSRFLDAEPEFHRPLFDISRLEGYRLGQVTEIRQDVPAPPLPTGDPGNEHLRSMLGRSLTLVMVIGALIILWPLHYRARRLLGHPAFWLVMVGLCGLVVAPIPVAVALLVVAVSVPWLPWADGA